MNPTDAELREKELSGAELIAQERARQISSEGYSSEHDDQHTEGELAQVASAYVVPWFTRIFNDKGVSFGINRLFLWPKYDGWNFKPHNGQDGLAILTKEQRDNGRIHDLVKSGALIAAEIDRLLRARKETK